MESYSRNKTSGHKNTVDDEVRRLFKQSKGASDDSIFLKLREKYDDEKLVEQIQTMFLERHNKIVKKAKKFATLVREKYSDSSYPFHVLLGKALLYKKKHNLSEEEFEVFKRIYEQDLSGAASPEVAIPVTNMMKILGSINTGFTGPKLKVSDAEYKPLQEILKSYSINKPLHAQVMLQSIQYKDCDYEAVSGKYNRDLGQIPGEHIHPVVAALFLPKIPVLESHFIYSNMAGIVQARHTEEPLMTKPDYELFYALVTDPNDVVCSTSSPMEDLLKRTNVQVQLWQSVLHLRNGQYYHTMFRDFINAIDFCRLNKYDNPDLVYGRFDGTVMKRLLAAFSFRPTVVATSNVVQMFSMNPYLQGVRPVVTTIPMINLRLPINLQSTSPVLLSNALAQQQFFLEGNVVVPKYTDLIYSRGVLVFYVDRRASIIRVQNQPPFNMGVFPQPLAGFERLNDKSVDFENVIKVRGDHYNLRSVVISEVNSEIKNQNIVVGSSAAIMKHADPAAGRFTNEYIHYDPYGVVSYVKSAGASNNFHNAPITVIDGTPGLGPKGSSFQEMASSRGCIFVYELTIDKTEGYLQL